MKMKHLILSILILLSFCGYGQNTESQNLTLINIVRNQTLSPARVANALDALNYSKQGILQAFTAAGTDTYTVTGPTAITAYASGQIVIVTFTNANTGAATLNINSIGAAALKDNEGSALSAGALVAGGTYMFKHNGTNFWMVGASGGGVGGTGTVESVTGDGVDNTDPDNPVLTFPTPAEIGAQETLVSGTNIKTVNGNALPGTGDIDLIDDAIVNGETKAPSQNAVYDANALKADLAGATFSGDVIVPDEAYDATAWNGSLEVPTKNAIRDKIETLGAGSGTVTSVGLTAGTGGSDVNVSGSPVTTSGAITLNIPDAGAAARGVVTTGTQTLAGAKTFSSDVTVPDEAYDATAWNSSLEVPTKNALRDKIETISAAAADGTWLDVKDYFTAGVTLATSTQQQRVDAWQAAIAAAQTGSYGIKFSGTWDLPTDSLVVTDQLTIMGIGYGSALTTTVSSGTVLLVNSHVPRVYYNVVFPQVKPFRAENFIVRYLGASNPSSTSTGIKVTDANGMSFLHKFVKVTIDSFYVGMSLNNVANAEVTGCYFRNNRAYGVLNTNSESMDYGKLMLHHNIFSTSGTFSGSGAPDTTAHVKIEGGAGFDISYNDMYGTTDYGVWTYLRNTSEYFAANGSTEYYFKNNKVLFVQDYAFLFMSNYGTVKKGNARAGNKIQNVQIQGNNTGFNGLVKVADGGIGAFYEFQITENFNEYPYGTTSHNVFVTPIYLNAGAMTNTVISDNIFVANPLGGSGSTSSKATTVSGTLLGTTSVQGNTYVGYTGALTAVSDIETYARIGIGRVPGSTIALDLTSSGNVYQRFSRPANSNDNGIIFTPFSTLSSSNPQFFVGQPASQSYFSIQRYDGSTATNVLMVAAATNNVGIGSTAPTARLQLAAGTATASSAPLKFTSGTALTTPEAGVLELTTLEPLYSTSTTTASRGYFELGRVTATATSLTADANHNTIVVTATGQTITLPTAVGRLGRIYTVKLSASGTGTVATTSSQTIDGSTTYSLSAQYKYVTVQSDNANWHIIANN
jgi:hypothetical protein